MKLADILSLAIFAGSRLPEGGKASMLPSMHGMLFEIVYLLAGAVILVPLAKRIGIGSVTGYLVAGLVLGPFVMQLVTSTEDLAEVSELGVVFLLFIIGLELDPKKLWELKVPIFAMGAAQIVTLSLACGGLAWLLGFKCVNGMIIGGGVAMSSTAIVTQVLKERGILSTTGGRSAFSILLFQDMAVVPLLALLPWMAGSSESLQQPAAPVWQILAVIALVILLGHFLLRHVFRAVAAVNQREMFTALCLLMVVGAALMMETLGVSMGLGAFLGGVLLATSEYRHAIETDLEPFKGLLLGLFFMVVGMSVDIHVIAAHPFYIAALVFGAIALKFVIHLGLGFVFGVPKRELVLFALMLSQVGEFAFVLFSAAVVVKLIDPEQAAILSAVVALSMALTPLLIKLYDKFLQPWLTDCNKYQAETVHDDHPEVIIAGFGRVGQIVGRLLFVNRFRATILDHDPQQIEVLRKYGFKVYYGDATRIDLLEAAGAANAKILVVAVDSVQASLEIVDVAQEHFPHLKLIVRARNLAHAYDLIERGVILWQRETFESSLKMASDVLTELGWERERAEAAANTFRDHNLQLVQKLARSRDNEKELISLTKQARADLEKMFAETNEQLGQDTAPQVPI